MKERLLYLPRVNDLHVGDTVTGEDGIQRPVTMIRRWRDGDMTLTQPELDGGVLMPVVEDNRPASQHAFIGACRRGCCPDTTTVAEPDLLPWEGSRRKGGLSNQD